MHKFSWLLTLVLLLFPITILGQENPWKERTVISVIDADTVVLDNGEVVKLIGISSPRAKHGKKEGDTFGEEARHLAEDMLLGKKIEVGFDIAYGQSGHRDKYGRALIYVTIPHGIEKSIANIDLLKLGAGFYLPAEQELQIGAALKRAEAEARKRKVGVWGKLEVSPIETAQTEGKSFEEPVPSLNLNTFRIAKPIKEGPGVNSDTTVAVNNTPRDKSTTVPLDMDSVRPINPNAGKKPDPPKPVNITVDNKNSVYDLASRSPLFSAYEGTQKIELYKAVSLDQDTTYRIGVKVDSKEITFITNYNGIKELDKLLAKGTESQPTLGSVQSTIGSFGGQHGTNVTISTGKDGGLFLNISGKEGNSKFYLTRQDARRMQLIIEGI